MALFKVSTYDGRVNPSSRRLAMEASEQRNGVAVIRRASADGSKASTGTIIKRGGVAGPASTPGGGLAAPGGLRTPSTIRNQTGNPLLDNSLVDYWIPIDPVGLHQLWRRIYLRDPICGPAIDFFRELPWSEWTLSGVDDKLLQRYDDTLHRINLLGWLPEFSGDFLVLGKGCLHLLWDRTKGEWRDLIIHDPDHIEVSIVPLVNQPIKVDLKPTPAHQAFILSPDPRDQMARKELDPNIIRMILSGEPIPLDPRNTLYLPRRAFPYDVEGVSLFCVAGSTRIPTQFGLVRVDQLPKLLRLDRQPRIRIDDERYEYETGLSLKSEVYGQRTAVTNWIYSGVRPTLQLRTELGYRLTVTPNEKVRVLNTQLELEWKRADALTVGDQLVVQPGTDTLWPEHEPRLGKFRRWVPKSNEEQDKHLARIPRRMSPSLARVLGYLVAEGHVGENHVSFTNSDEFVLQDYQTAFARVFGLDLSEKLLLADTHNQRHAEGRQGYAFKRNKDASVITCSSTELVLYLEHLGYRRGSKSAAKRVPKHLWRSTRVSVRAFLQALFEGDGSITANQVDYATRSRRLAREVQLLLLQFGIAASCRFHPVAKMWHVLLGNRGYVQFNEKIGFRSPTKLGVWTANQERIRADNNSTLYAVPGIREAVLAECEQRLVANDRIPAYATVGLPPAGGRTFLKLADGSVAASTFPMRVRHLKVTATPTNDAFMAELATISPSLHQRLIKLRDAQLVFSPVTAIKQGQVRPVYDVTVGKVHEFVANGLVISNSRTIYFIALERSLFTASILAARRRAGPVTHIAAGNEEWEPTNEELDALALAYMESEEDAVSAVFATRNDVQVNRAVSSLQADLWKINDESQFISEGKMRALGINDAFLCLPGNTLLPTLERGLIRLDSISSGQEGEAQPISLTVGSSVKAATAAKWIFNGEKPLLRLTTKHGYRIEATAQHRCLVLNDTTLETEWKQAKDIGLGERLCLSMTPVVRTTSLALDLPSPVRSKYTAHVELPLRPTTMTPELAFVLGMVVSVGHHDPHRVRVVNHDTALLDRYEDLVKKTFGLTPTRTTCYSEERGYIHGGTRTAHTKNSYESVVDSSVLASWLTYLGVHSGGKRGKTSSRYKEVPWSILEADESSQLAYLAACFESNGHTARNGSALAFYASSAKTLRQMQILLAAHGILSRRLPKKYHRLELDAKFSWTLYQKIGPYLVSKRAASDKWRTSHHTFGVPIGGLKAALEERTVLADATGTWFLNDDGVEVYVHRWKSSLQSVGDSLLYQSYREGRYTAFMDRLQLISPLLYKRLLTLLHSEYYFDPLSAIKDVGTKKVYDLTMVEGCEPAFVANGIIVHNSGDASINTTEAATSVFLERIRAHRRLMTERVVQQKIFREMARANRWVKRTPAEITHHVREDSDEQAAQDDDRLAIPTINWTKSLKPTADEQLINLLRQAQEWGLPITIRDLASATGIDIDGVLSDQTEEAELRTKIKTWQDTMQKTGITTGAMAPGGEGGGGMIPPGGGYEMPGMPPEGPPAGGEAPSGGEGGEAPEGMATAASFGGNIEDAIQQRIAALPIWNDTGRCINVHRDQLRELLHQPEMQQKLARGISWRALQKHLRNGYTFTERETEVIGYALHRVGLVPDFVVPPGFARAVMQSCGRDLDNNAGLLRELQYMERFSTVRRRLDAAGANARLKRELAIPGRRLYTGV
jgi:intein/homing endonuclease